MTLTTVRTHEELLTLARKLRAAAQDGDPDRVENASLKLYDALLAHLSAEQPDLGRLAPPELRVLTRGQQRLLDELAEVAARAHMHGPCRCAVRAEDVVARLFLQAADERRALGHS